MGKEWWNTPMVAWAFTAISIGGGIVLTFFSPCVGIPIGGVILAFGICLLIRAYRMKRKALKSPLNPSEKQLQLDVGKFLLEGKEMLMSLEKMDGRLDAAGAASAELAFEIWYKGVSKTLQNTDYDQLWFENKEGLDYRKAKKSDYVEACKYGLGRLEYIKQLMFDTEGSQSLGDGIQSIVRSKDDYSDIEVNPFVESIPEYNHYKYNAILEVHNIGKKGNFTANATILEGRQKSKQYSMYWKLPPYSNQDINKNDKKFILVAGISEEDNDKEGIYKNGIVIYGFSGSTLEKYGVSEKKTVEDYYYKKVYPTMYKDKLLPKDTCVIEVIITSDQPLLNEFKQRYAIEIAHEQGDKLLFTPLPESNPDKVGSQI